MNRIQMTLGQLVHELVESYRAYYGDPALAVLAAESQLNDYFFIAAADHQSITAARLHAAGRVCCGDVP